MKEFYFLLCILFPIYLLGQETSFSGKIYADSISTTQINIVNLTKEIGSTNKVDGAFKISANAGDEVLFSSVQYQPYQVSVTEEMLQKSTNNIFLFPEVNQLQEVKISNIDLTGNLGSDAANMDIYVFDPRSVGLPNAAPVSSVEDRRLRAAQSGGPVGLLIDVLTGRLAMLKRMKEIADFEMLIDNGKHLVSISFLEKELLIPTAYIDDFFYFCAKDEQFKSLVKNANQFKFMTFLSSKKQAYFDFKKWK